MKITRRDFIRTTGAAGAGMMVFAPALDAFSKAKPTNPNLLSESWISTTCQGCTTWDPIQALVQNGKVVKVKGNPYSKYNPGHTCPRGHLIPQQTYDPDRLRVPMKRTNTAKGKGVNPAFVPITWTEAIQTIATQLMNNRTDATAMQLLYLRGRYTYSRDLFYKAFMKIYGSPNSISHSAICAEVEKGATFFTTGKWIYRDYDLSKVRYLVFWGTDPFRANRSIPLLMSKWKLIKEQATVVTVDPLFSGAAAKSDKWLPIKPGEDGALASAIAHHILVKGLWSREFVGDFNGTGATSFVANTTVNASDFTEKETSGLIQWWNLELLDKTPAWAATKTGLAQQDIEDLAEGMAAVAPNVTLWYGPTMHPRGLYTAMAINAVNGLLGSFDNEGGPLGRSGAPKNGILDPAAYEDSIASNNIAKAIIDQRGQKDYWPALPEAGTPGQGVITNNTATAMLAADPYAIKVVIANRQNIVFSGANNKRWEDALGDNNPNGAPFTVHITTHASELSHFADIVLPAKFDGVETWSLLDTGGNLYGEITLQQPLITPLFDTRQGENEIPWMIAEELANQGFTNILDYFKTYVDPETSAAPTNYSEFALYATKYFTQPSWSLMIGGWNEYKTKGVYSKGPYKYKTLWGAWGTPSTKFEFYSQKLKTGLDTFAASRGKTTDEIVAACNYTATGDLAFVPHYEPPKRTGDLATYPFDWVDCKSRFNREGRSQNLPNYYQFKKLDPGDSNWADVIKINPADAATLGISDGDRVKVTSPTGQYITVKAKLYEGVRPGCVAKTYGQGHWAYGRFASQYASLTENTDCGNNNVVQIEDYEHYTGATARNGGHFGVKIEKV